MGMESEAHMEESRRVLSMAEWYALLTVSEFDASWDRVG